jgi:hypothetical protein
MELTCRLHQLYCGSYNIQHDFGVLMCQDCQWTWEPDEEEQVIINQ